MIRQAKNYLVGARSGATLIGIAIAAFVVIVSAQVFHEWPIADTGGQPQKSSVAPARAVTPVGVGAEDATAASKATARALRAPGASAGRAAKSDSKRHTRRATSGDPGADTDVTAPATVVEPAPSTSGGEPSGSGNSGSRSSQPTPSPSPAASPSTAGTTNSGSGSGSTKSGAPAAGTTGTSGSPGQTGGGPVTEPPTTVAAKPAQTVTETVNGTVDEVDHTAGGTLENAGVTPTTEEAVNGVAGPESPVGGTVEGAAEAVGGVLGAGGH